jgi:hypothetical protein
MAKFLFIHSDQIDGEQRQFAVNLDHVVRVAELPSGRVRIDMIGGVWVETGGPAATLMDAISKAVR